MKHRFRHAKSFTRKGWRLAAAVAACALVSRGAFLLARSTPWWALAAAGALALAMCTALYRRIRIDPEAPAPPWREELELALAAVASSFVVVQVTGGPDSSAYPLVYLAAAAVVLFFSRWVALAAVVLALATDLGQFHGLGLLAARWPTLAAHGGFVVLFAALYHALLAGRLGAARRSEREAVERRIREAEQRAREYRLIVGGAPPEEEQRAKWTLAAVAEVETAVESALEVTALALRPHTVAVFLLTPDDQALLLRECLSPSEAVTRTPVRAGEGVLGGVVRRKAPLRLAGDLKLAGYYDDATRVRALCAVPLMDGEYVRGVLVADRTEERPFSEDDEKLLLAMAREILRAIEVERVMGYIRKEKDEKEHFYRAIEELNKTSKQAEVCAKTLELARALCPAIDLCALTLVEEKKHRVALAVGEGAEALTGLSFADNAGLVSNVVRLGAPLPGRDVRAMEHVAPFDHKTVLKGLGSLKIFPLRAGDGVAGTLIAASKRREAFNDDAQRMLAVIALQAAESLTRARLFEATERLATTDGLTGLTNHRTFQVLLESALAQAERYSKRVSVLLCDIDHFKMVNDTYGHPAGDLVLRGVARVLARMARATDNVARYGGEEFAVIMPETDSGGALAIAERIRKAVGAEEFQTEVGALRVTMSLGVATYPEDAEAKAALVERADQALYQAKRGGRNRCVTWTMLAGVRRVG